MFKDLILKNRSYRRFNQDVIIEDPLLKELVELASLSASASNLQPLKYILSSDFEKNNQIFSCLAWAGYLKDWPGPSEGERPCAYIVILGDTEISKSFGCDHGIAAQSILLGASEKGFGGCMIGSIKRQKLRKILDIPLRYRILLILALGEPREEVVVDQVGVDKNIKYWRDQENIHHVPKRPLSEIILSIH